MTGGLSLIRLEALERHPRNGLLVGRPRPKGEKRRREEVGRDMPEQRQG